MNSLESPAKNGKYGSKDISNMLIFPTADE